MSWYENAARDPSIGPIVPVGKTVGRARGYSLLELEHAGLTNDDVERLGIDIDPERDSMIGANVMQLIRRLRAQRIDSSSRLFCARCSVAGLSDIDSGCP